ncbi:CynX/NimT family MFS transporter [Pantoea sp. B65]|uniref:MFS transporter n=1 Tax=Pantoea sp. B65 TaxID=2813359 RepID=UPI0039B38B30
MKNISPDDAITASDVSAKTSSLYNVLLLVAFIALAANLRSPLTSLPSVIDSIRSDLHISPGLAGLMTTIPVLCFGALMPVASVILARVGIGKAIYLTLCGVVLGTILRSAGGLTLALSGTVVIGAALTLGNIVSLMVIARDFQRHSSIITGVYVMSMSIGAMLTAALTVPIASVIGWRAALAIWSLLAILAIVLWIGAGFVRATPPAGGVYSVPSGAARAPGATVSPSAREALAVWRRPVVWLLAIAFSSHTFLFYAMTAWLPEYIKPVVNMDTSQAGTIASIFQILGILGCFGVPWLGSVARFPTAKLFLIAGGVWFCMAAGLLLLPQMWPLWILSGGIGAGAGFVVVFMRVMELAGSLDENRRISSFVQGFGYIVASTGPTVVGYIHQQSGGWSGVFTLLSTIALVMISTGIIAAKSK